MTKELLQQALDALESMESLVDGYYIPRGKQYTPECEAAIDAIRAHLAAQPAPVPVPVPLTQCNTNDSPWLICKTCAAVGRCAQACGTKPLSLDFIDRHIGPDEGDREAVIEIVRQVEAAHGIAASPEVPK